MALRSPHSSMMFTGVDGNLALAVVVLGQAVFWLGVILWVFG